MTCPGCNKQYEDLGNKAFSCERCGRLLIVDHFSRWIDGKLYSFPRLKFYNDK